MDFAGDCPANQCLSRHSVLPQQPSATPPNMQKAEFDFKTAAAALTDAAARAGACIMRHYAEKPQSELKADQSPVTLADRASEAILLEALAKLAPDIPVISEEAFAQSGHDGALQERFFLVDPLDGTKEFIKRRDDFTVNIALIEDGTPRFGLVYAPARNLLALTVGPGSAAEAFLEPSDGGALFESLELKPLRARLANEQALSAVVSYSHLDAETEAFLEERAVSGKMGAGSSLKFILVARGEADVYPRFGPTMVWDTAAGHAVLAAAGGEVVCPDGKPLRYDRPAGALKNPSFIAWGRRA
jgi:3'(2'), 5'-bisphosphate nucleotidase